MVKNVVQCFPNPKMTSWNVVFCPQLKGIQFTLIGEQINQELLPFKKLKSENFDILFFKNYLKPLLK